MNNIADGARLVFVICMVTVMTGSVGGRVLRPTRSAPPRPAPHSPGRVTVVDVVAGVLEVGEDSLKRTGRQLGVEPLVVEEDVLVEVLEAAGAHHVVRHLAELRK